jgi:hypothetical protein
VPKNMDRDIFDFCEKRFNELKMQDKGYHPHIHDSLVFEDAASEYNVSVEEVNKIYDRITKLSAKIEMARINRLPKNKRKEAMMQKMVDIVLDNHDLPFYRLEGEPSEPLKPHNTVILEEYETMVNNVALQGWTLPLSFDISELDELNKHAKSPSDLENYLELFYSDSRFYEMLDYITQHISNKGQKTRFKESIEIYKQQLYSSCSVILTTILEGLISTFGDDPKDVRIMRICRYHEGEELRKDNRLKALYWKSIHAYTTILFEKNDFSSAEPNSINRHWLIHGRTMKTSEKMDCLRLFNAISTIVSLIENQT